MLNAICVMLLLCRCASLAVYYFEPYTEAAFIKAVSFIFGKSANSVLAAVFNIKDTQMWLCFESLCIFFGNAFLDRLGSAFNEVFCFFESKTGDFTYDLDNAELAVACSCEDYVEFRLFFSCCAACRGSCRAGYRYGSCRYAEFFLESLYEIRKFEYCKCLDFFNNLQ